MLAIITAFAEKIWEIIENLLAAFGTFFTTFSIFIFRDIGYIIQ